MSSVRLRRGTVLRVLDERPGALELEVEVEGSRASAIAYPALVGPVGEGDAVVLNTTARTLRLGTGGMDLGIESDPNGLQLVPEPSTYALVGMALAALALVRRRRAR